MPRFEIPMSTSKRNPAESSQMQKSTTYSEWETSEGKWQRLEFNKATRPTRMLWVSQMLIQVAAVGVSDNPGVDTASVSRSAEHHSYSGLIDSLWS